MKKIIEQEVAVCDVCKSDKNVFNRCIQCGKDLCFECIKTHEVKYNHVVNSGYSGDGRYCLSCDSMLRKLGTDKLHNAFMTVHFLREEADNWYKNFKIRSDKAEEILKIASKASKELLY